jgi:hypothetical protein
MTMTERLYDDPAPFRNQSFASRYARMGDEAEGAYERHRESIGRKFLRYGWNRPDINGMQFGSMPPLVRYMPDFIEWETARKPRLVECVGYAADGKAKLKVEKLQALQEWNRAMPVVLFMYSSTTSSFIEIPVEIIAEFTRGNPTKRFPDNNKPYYELKATDFISPFQDPVEVAA